MGVATSTYIDQRAFHGFTFLKETTPKKSGLIRWYSRAQCKPGQGFCETERVTGKESKFGTKAW